MILPETISIIEGLYGESLKRIAIERIVIGIFFTGVKLSNGCGGVSYTPVSEIHEDVSRKSPIFTKDRPVVLKGMSAHEVLNGLSDTPMYTTVKLVVLNALSTLFFSHERYFIIEDGDALDSINLDIAKRVCMVGAFPPFLERFKKINNNIQLSVVERRKESLTGDNARYFVPASDARSIIPLCDTIIITGASIANGTIDELLSYTRPDAQVIVTGPTASFLPDAFFRRNVNVVSGISVTRPDEALDMLSEGVGAYHLFKGCVKKMNVLDRI
jgi:uncharacterized protein (DUF4213/DUF364 family)